MLHKWAAFSKEWTSEVKKPMDYQTTSEVVKGLVCQKNFEMIPKFQVVRFAGSQTWYD